MAQWSGHMIRRFILAFVAVVALSVSLLPARADALAGWTLLAATPNAKVQLYVCKDGPWSSAYGSLWRLWYYGFNYFAYDVRVYARVERPPTFATVASKSWIVPHNFSAFGGYLWASVPLNDGTVGTVTDPAVFYTGPRLYPNTTQIVHC